MVCETKDDKLNNSRDIDEFVNKLFNTGKKALSLDEYTKYNLNVSSELFYSVMSVFHQQIPFAETFFRMKRQYREMQNLKGDGEVSPSRKIASPCFFKEHSQWSPVK